METTARNDTSTALPYTYMCFAFSQPPPAAQDQGGRAIVASGSGSLQSGHTAKIRQARELELATMSVIKGWRYGKDRITNFSCMPDTHYPSDIYVYPTILRPSVTLCD